MTEVLTLDPPPSGAAACTNCGAPLHGPFCAACGQEVKPLDPPVRHFIGEFSRELFDLDRRILQSLRRLFFSPGFLTREHNEGRRVTWVSPLKLYLSTSVLCFTVLALIGDSGGVQFTQHGDPADTSGVQRLGFSSLAELQATADAARATWMPRVMFVLVPLIAWLVALVRRHSGRRYPAHLVFTLHVYAAAFGVRAVTAALGAISAPVVDAVLANLTGLYVVAYMYLAFRSAYGLAAGKAIRDTMLLAIGSWFALIAGTAAVVVAAVFGRGWLAALGL